jgi:arginyl-tRNA--protein-N-Asp/Glu arginylyltransferase
VKLLFSEQNPDYSIYQYPYIVWAAPEAGETPADIFNAGFLPSAGRLDRYYMCRQIRIPLKGFALTSENRRILRKGDGINVELVPRANFDYSAARREFFKSYADARFGPDIMTYERLDGLLNSPLITHLLIFTDAQSGQEIGVATIYVEEGKLSFYQYGFYDLNYFNRSLGLFMMTTAADYFAARGFEYLYLGTCYSERALYKIQFDGVEFFTGFRWSQDMVELKYLLRREKGKAHLLETESYRAEFYHGKLEEIFAASKFSVRTG